jgi:hypothetical protein
VEANIPSLPYLDAILKEMTYSTYIPVDHRSLST